MTDTEAFLQAILTSPDDDVPRLQYADYLEEQGNPHGLFIRLQVEIARLEARENELRRQADDLVRLNAPIENYFEERGLDHRWVKETQRGFAEKLELSAEDWLKHADRILACNPIRVVVLTTESNPCYEIRMTRVTSNFRLPGRKTWRSYFPAPDFRQLLEDEWPGIQFVVTAPWMSIFSSGAIRSGGMSVYHLPAANPTPNRSN